MSALTQLLTNKGHQVGAGVTVDSTASKVSFKKVTEALWCATSFLLFLALGPFSAIAAVMGVASLISGQAGKVEPGSVS